MARNDIRLYDANGIIVTGLTSTAGSVLVSDTGDLVVNRAVAAATNVGLYADGDIVLNAGVTSALGNITLHAASNVTQNAGGNLVVQSGPGSIDVEAAASSIAMTDGTVAQTTPAAAAIVWR